MLKRVGFFAALAVTVVLLLLTVPYTNFLSPPLITPSQSVNSDSNKGSKNDNSNSNNNDNNSNNKMIAETLQHVDLIQQSEILKDIDDEWKDLKGNDDERTANGKLKSLKRLLGRTMDTVKYQSKVIRDHSVLLKQMTDIIQNQDRTISNINKSLANMHPKLEEMYSSIQIEKDRKFIMTYSKQLDLLSTKPYQGMKFVHLDLKGSAPRIEYLVKFMKLAKEYGATGFLVEYEDMFPWSGDLSVLRRETSYTVRDVKRILFTAHDLQMEIIPLIQTYGHMEFVLKHEQFEHLRRIFNDKKSINSANEESVPFVKSLIDQILEQHPSIRWLHIGGDEVEGLESCDGCADLQMMSAEIYQHHMIPILQYVKSKRNDQNENITPIIWDDMMRRWSVPNIKVITEYAIPMVWAYVPNLSRHDSFPDDMWVRYTQGMSKIFFASAFKGASGSNTNLMEVDEHAKNTIGWLQIITMFEKLGRKVEGIALTGWSRYMHEFPLCELLPVGTPSLALCLKILHVGKYDSLVVKNVSKSLGLRKITGQTRVFSNPDGYKSNVVNGSNFLGADVYLIVERFSRVQSKIKNLDRFLTKKIFLSNLLSELKNVQNEVEKSFPNYFYDDTTKEWIDDKITGDMRNLRSSLAMIQEDEIRRNRKNRPKRKNIKQSNDDDKHQKKNRKSRWKNVDQSIQI